MKPTQQPRFILRGAYNVRRKRFELSVYDSLRSVHHFGRKPYTPESGAAVAKARSRTEATPTIKPYWGKEK